MSNEDYTNKQYNDWLVIKNSYIEKGRHSTRWVHCRCLLCNTEYVRRFGDIKSGHSTSCGCWKKQTGSKHRIWKGVGDISKTYHSIVKRNAKTRNFTFDLTLEEMWNLFLKQDKRCALSNELLTFAPSSIDRNLQTASFDRIDSNQGYPINNVQWVHKDINTLKGPCPDEAFIVWCNKVAKKHPRII